MGTKAGLQRLEVLIKGLQELPELLLFTGWLPLPPLLLQHTGWRCFLRTSKYYILRSL